MTKSYAELMQMAHQRHHDITTELKALEAAFPEILAREKRPVKRGRGSFKRTPEQRAEHSLAMKAAWARRKKANGSEQSVSAAVNEISETNSYGL